MTVASDALPLMTNAVYSTLGVAAVYTDRTSAASNVTVVIDRSIGRYGTVAQVSAKTAVLCVRTTEVAQVPLRGETFVVGAITYTVDSAVAGDEYEHRVLVSLS